MVQDDLFKRERGWYLLSPDGLAMGPYVTERMAETQAVRLASAPILNVRFRTELERRCG